MQVLSRDIPARGGHSWFNPGWREGVSSHFGKECPSPKNHKPVPAFGMGAGFFLVDLDVFLSIVVSIVYKPHPRGMKPSPLGAS